ncbi:MAG: hypothetical protein HWE21_15645 [Cytophagia bacterium]|nr:hypothetical protein [Cytophagia bacterium]
MKGLTTIVFIMLFLGTLTLDAYAKSMVEQSVTYELIETEEDQQDTEEGDSKDEFKKDEYFNFLENINFHSNLLDTQFAERSNSWKLDVLDVLLRPPMR